MLEGRQGVIESRRTFCLYHRFVWAPAGGRQAPHILLGRESDRVSGRSKPSPIRWILTVTELAESPTWLTPSAVAEGQSDRVCGVPRSLLPLWSSGFTSLSSSTLSASVNMTKSSGKLPDSPVTLNSWSPKSCSAEKVSFACLLNNSGWVSLALCAVDMGNVRRAVPRGATVDLTRFNDLGSWHKSLEMSRFELRLFKCHCPSVNPEDLLSRAE